MWIIFLKGLCVLVRVGIIHKSKSLPGTDEFFSTVPGKDFDLCIIPTRTKARFRRRTFHGPNLMQMSSNKDFRSLTLGSAHEKFDV